MIRRPFVTHGPEPLPTPRERQAIRRRLLGWYDRNARDLPWRRRADDPYAQWVAEIMLQQTQVDTVIPYYDRFLARFPDVNKLARATNDQLMRQWEGLGYYRRAANLHRAAKLIAAAGGQVPASAESLLALPGVGRYTAGAIASIAYDERAAAVDGNVARVLSRLFNITAEVSSPDTQRRLWAVAESLLPAKRCGDFNQAWMDLGATVCTPVGPRCERCPLASVCLAHQHGDPASLPRKTPARDVLEIHHVVAVIGHKDTYLLNRRPPGGLWGNLWEFPNRPIARPRDRLAGLRSMLSELGMPTRDTVRDAGTLDHRLTHRLMHFHTHVIDAAQPRRATAKPAGVRWVKSAQIEEFPMSTACRKILAIARR